MTELHCLEITIPNKGVFHAYITGRNLNKPGIIGDKTPVNFTIDYDKNEIIISSKDSNKRESYHIKNAFDYYFALIEYEENLKKAELIDSSEISSQARTNMLNELWSQIEDISFDEDEDKELILAQDFFIWEKGTPRSEIWQWFDKRYPNGIAEKL